MSSSEIVFGEVSPGYEDVKELFRQNAENGSEYNSQLCAYVKGEKVVDLWSISAYGESDKKYNGDTLQNIFSSTKSVTAICVACLVDQGLLDYNEKVTKYWPEWGQHGKEGVTLADVLRHEGGVASSLSQTVPWESVSREAIKNNAIGKVLEDSVLKYPPKETGTKREYHGISRGWILNEIFRRVEPNGRTIGEFLRDEISGPLDIDVIIGVEEKDEARVTDLKSWGMSYVMAQSCLPKWLGRKVEPSMLDFIRIFRMIREYQQAPEGKPKSALDTGKGVGNMVPHFNTWLCRRGEIPSSNGICSARGLAKLGSFMVEKGGIVANGKTVLSDEGIRKLHQEPIRAKFYQMMGLDIEFTQGGVAVFRPHPEDDILNQRMKTPRDGYVGWFGMGGSTFQWHPELRIGFGFTRNLVHWYDFENTAAAKYQEAVAKCARKLQE